MELICLGLNHRTAPVDVRERFAVAEPKLGEAAGRLRALDGLQTADANACALPVNWRPGEKVIVPPPTTIADVTERETNEAYERLDFYLNKRSL